MANERLKLTALWEKQVNGKRVLTGRLENLDIEIWENGYKKESKQPDWIVYVKPKYVKPQEAQHTFGAEPVFSTDFNNDNDLPF
jgi:hypothetical protein